MTLNIWGAHIYQPLIDFIKGHENIDIFCFQEIYRQAPKMITNEDRFVDLDFFSKVESLLSSHTGYFSPVIDGIYGIAIFIKNTIDVVGKGEAYIHDNPNYSGIGPDHSRKLQWVEFKLNKQNYTIANVHGLWNGRGKTDSSDRLKQSQKIVEFMSSIKTPLILCGDFNLRPDTKSIGMIRSNLRDLIWEYEIRDTRTSFYHKPERFADYVFVSKCMNVKSFNVLSDQVSDHAPLLFELG